MQGVTVSWVGQSSCLPKCSASRESKSRIRRTKEERKTMVMSFIKKYQSSNNGKFPSLNLTHKEVGGSFYTVREIVRDIIQENKVLGPGNPSSKLLNLEYYSEEEADNKDTNNKISVTTRFEESTNISNCGADNHQVLTLIDDMLHLDSSSETVDLAVSNTSQISRSAHKVHLPSEPFVKGTVIYSSELETSGSDREIASNSSSTAKGNVPFIPFHKVPFTSSAQSREIASYREQGIDAADEKSVDSFVLQTTRSPAPGATENDIPLVDKSCSFVDTVKESENSSSKLVETAIQEADQSDIKFEKQSDSFSTVNGGGFMSSSNEEVIKESEMLETNPIWTAIKAFVSSFIKFWSE